MKVYVIKSCDGCYRTETGSFINDLRQAEFFLDYDVAKFYSPAMTLGDCEIVEVEIMQKKDLSDYTKQVRKEVCEEIKQKIEKRNNGTRNANYSVEYKDGYSGCCCDLEEVLDQIQGETKC